MNILVSGSSGLIGTALLADLGAAGHQVTRLVRGSTGGGGNGEIPWDPSAGTLDRAALASAGPFDAVVNLAGAGIGDKRWSPSRKQVILESRTASTGLLAAALAELPNPPAVLVSASAVGYYGDGGSEELTEATPAGHDFLSDVCVAWEAAAAPAVAAGIRTVFLRTGIVLSRHGGALGKQLPLFKVGIGGRMGPGTQYRSWITLDDEIGIIRHCLDHEAMTGPVNATAPNPATDGQFAKALGAALHRPTVVAVPATALRLVLGAEMAEELLLIGQRVLPAAALAGGYTFAHPELDEAVRSVLTPAP